MDTLPIQPGEDRQAELAFWLENARLGDQTIWQAIVEAYGNEIYRFLASGLRDLEGAGRKESSEFEKRLWEGTQAVFRQAGSQAGRFRGQSSLLSWLLGLAVHELRRQRRWTAPLSRWRKKFPPAQEKELGQGASSERVSGDDDQTLLAALLSLGREQRIALALREMHNLSLPETASALGLSIKTTRRKLLVARHSLLKLDRKLEDQALSTPPAAHPEIIRQLMAALDGLRGGVPQALPHLQPHLDTCADCRTFAQALWDYETRLKQAWEVDYAAKNLTLAQVEKLVQQAISKRLKPRRFNLRSPLVETAWVVAALAVVSFFSWRLLRQDTHASMPLFLPTPDITPTALPSRSPEIRRHPALDNTADGVGGLRTRYMEPALSSSGEFLALTFQLDRLEGTVSSDFDVYLYDFSEEQYRRVDVMPTGQPADGLSSSPSLSADGRWLVFSSDSSNLVPGQPPVCYSDGLESFCTRIFLFDRRTSLIEQIGLGVNSQQPDGHSLYPVISPDGNLIAFWSNATNLEAQDPVSKYCNPATPDVPCWDLYLYQRETGFLWSVLVGRQDSGSPYVEVNFSQDASLLAITLSKDDAWVSAMLGEASTQAYLFFTEANSWEELNWSEAGEVGNGPSLSPVISGDGRYVAFVSKASNLVAGDDNGKADVFVKDRQTGAIELVSRTNFGLPANGDSGAFYALVEMGMLGISADGRYVTFASTATNLLDIQGFDCLTGFGIQCLNVFVHDRLTGITTPVVEQPQLNAIYMLPSISADGRLVSAVRYDLECPRSPTCAVILLHDVQTRNTRVLPLLPEFAQVSALPGWKAASTLSAAWGGANSLAFSPDGSALAIGANDGSLGLWEVENGELIKRIPAHSMRISDLAFSPDGAWLASTSPDGTLGVYQATDLTMLQTQESTSGPLLSLAFSPGGDYLTVGSLGAAWSWALEETGFIMVDFERFPAVMVNRVAYSPDGELIALALSDQTLWLRRSSDDRVVARLAGHPGSVLSLAFSPDGKWLASGDAEGWVRLWQVESNGSGSWNFELVFILQHPDWVNGLAFSPDGQILAVASLGGGVSLWSIPGGQFLANTQIGEAGMATSVSFSPDGRWLAVGTSWGSVQLWERLK